MTLSLLLNPPADPNAVVLGSIASAESVPGIYLPEPATVELGSIAGPAFVPGPNLSILTDPGETTRIAAAAWSRDGALLADLDESYGRQWQEQLSDTGTGRVILQNDDPDLPAIAYGAVIRFSLDDQVRFSVLVERKEQVTLAPGEEVDQATTVSGRGTLAILEEAVVAPVDVDSALVGKVRRFSFAAAEYDDSAWASPVTTPLVRPAAPFRFPAAVDAAASSSELVWVAGADGGVATFAGAPFFGSLGGQALNAPITAIANRDDTGYWLAGADGGVFAFGSADYHGGMAGTPLNGPVVAIVPTTSGEGYWLVGSDGGIFAFGDAAPLGATPGGPAANPVDAVLRPGGGAWVVASDGGVFAFGAPFYGSMGGIVLNAPMRAIVATPSGGGYWLVGADTGIFAFGDAPVRLPYTPMQTTEYPDGQRAIIAAQLLGSANVRMIADDGATYDGGIP